MRAWTIGAGVVTAGMAVAAMAQGPGTGFPSEGRSISMHRPNGGPWAPAAFVCDGTNRDRVLVLAPNGRGRQVTLWSYAKPGLAARSVTLSLGRGDPGAGQIQYPLTTADGRLAGVIHAVNPGMVEPGATTPTVTWVRLGSDTTNCRFAPQTRVLGATAKRSVQVTQSTDGSYRYRSYNFDTHLPAIEQPWGGRDTRASTTVDGGRLVDQRGSRRVYEFARGGFVYRVMASTDAARPGGGVEVLRDGRTLLTEPFGAYTAALQP